MVMPSGAPAPSPDASTPELPAPPWRILLFGLLAVIAGLAVAFLTQRGPSVSYAGRITARLVPLTAERDGLLTEWLVEEGDAVRIGDPIAALSNSALIDRREQLELELVRLKLDLDRALAQAELELEWRIKDVNAEIFTARLQSAELLEEKYRHEMEKVALSDVLNNNSTALWAPKDSAFDSIVLKDADDPAGRLNTVLRAEAASNSADVCTAQVEMCEEQLALLEELKESLPERVRRSVGVDFIEQQIDELQSKREQLANEQPHVVMTSKVIGQAGVFRHKPGDYVSVGDMIVAIFDDVQRSVVVDVPSAEVDRFKVGKELPLRFPGNVERTGRVVRVAPQAVPSESDKGTVVRVHLEPAGLLWPQVPIESQVMVCVP
jgi:multidrug efflux pump subunit AcrA (membrane-fusion protein)